MIGMPLTTEWQLCLMNMTGRLPARPCRHWTHVMNHCKKVDRPGIPFWPEHPHEALARLLENPGKLLKPNRCFDAVTRHCLAIIGITVE